MSDAHGDRGPLPFDEPPLEEVVAERMNDVAEQRRLAKQLRAQAEAIARGQVRTDDVMQLLISQGQTLERLEQSFDEFRDDRDSDAQLIGNLAHQYGRLTRELTVNQAHRDWVSRQLLRIGRAVGAELEAPPPSVPTLEPVR